MKKILVLRGGALGDFIVTLPALALLRERWPQAQIELAGNATAAALARDAGLLDRVHSQHEARWATLYSSTPLPANFAQELAAFDLIISYWPDPDGELRARFPLRAAQTFLSAAAMPTQAPAAAHYCEPLRALGLTPRRLWYSLAQPAIAPFLVANPAATASEVGRLVPKPPPPQASSPPSGALGITRLTFSDQPSSRPRIALHPGSGSPRKNWPLAHWIELCDWLTQELNADLLIITGEADQTAASALARFGTSADALPLTTLTRELASCRLFLGHDSGVSHLAAACEVPSILLFGPTDPATWAPPAPHVTILRAEPDPALASLSPARVQQAVRTALAADK